MSESLSTANAATLSTFLSRVVPSHVRSVDVGNDDHNVTGHMADAKIAAFLADHAAEDFDLYLFDVDEDVTGEAFGFTIILPADHDAVAKMPPPTARLSSAGERKVAFAYFFGEGEDVSSIAVEFKKREGEDWRLSDDMPLPGRSWTLDSVGELVGAEIGPALQIALRGFYKLRDAKVFGGVIPDTYLAKLVRVSRAGSAEERFWVTTPPILFGDFLDTTLARHPEDKSKDGPSTVYASLHPVGEAHKAEIKRRRIKLPTDHTIGLRTAKNVTVVYAMGLDCDSGLDPFVVFESARRLGLFVILYATHSHLKRGIKVTQDRYFKWARENGLDGEEPDNDSVRAFLRMEGKYEPEIIESATFVNIAFDDEKSGGMFVNIDTAPIPKFRLLFLLDEPYDIADQKMAQKDAIQQWRELVLGMGAKLGIKVDKAATDCSRLFYDPVITRIVLTISL